MKHLALTILVGTVVAATASAQGLSASSYITYVQNGSAWDYDVHLTNTGTTNIGTFWYSWIPGGGFLPTPPTNVSGPTGWNAGALTDGGKSVQWLATTPLTPGQSIGGFKFTSTDSPATLSGVNGGFPVGTSFVYIKQPFGDAGYMSVVNPVVEPSAESIIKGIHVSGSVSDLFNADGSYLVARTAAARRRSDVGVTVTISGTSTQASPTSLRLFLVAHVNSTNIGQKVELFDYVANAWVTVDTTSASLTDTTEVAVASNPSRFVQSGTLAMQARLSWAATGVASVFPWSVSIDQAVWNVTP